MPTLMRHRNVWIVIYSNDHPPAHVRAIGPGDSRARYELNCPEGPVRVTQNQGFNAAQVNQMGKAIAEQISSLCLNWKVIHG
jgi:hypothetical protein